jgi:short-subunit dehydrogenase
MKQAIITGASKGLGNAIAHELAAKGYDLLLIARSEELLATEAQALSNQHPINAHYLSLDLSDPLATAQVVKWCNEKQFNPSVLINNAGYACWGFFESLDLEAQQNMLHVNMHSMVNLTYSLLPSLKKHPKSYILNVASTAAFQSVPTMALYAASKAFVRSFSRSLRYELMKSTVSVTCLSPGPIATNFIAQANMQPMQQTAEKFEMTAQEVARKGLAAMFKGKSESVPGFLNLLNVRLSFIMPDALLEKVAANLYMSKL